MSIKYSPVAGALGAMSRYGLASLVRLEGTFTGAAYASLIADVLIPYAMDGPFPDGDHIFQRDQSPVHTAGGV